MSILTGNEIDRQVKAGRIFIDPYNPKRLNPNSYNVRLGPKLLCYAFDNEQCLSTRKANPTYEYEIPEKGFLLCPGTLYLGSTIEAGGSDYYVPEITGRSSGGRLGLQIHSTAALGDLGFSGNAEYSATWTLEIMVVHPLLVFVEDEVAQLVFTTAEGKIDRLYRGKYAKQQGPVASKLLGR